MAQKEANQLPVRVQTIGAQCLTQLAVLFNSPSQAAFVLQPLAA